MCLNDISGLASLTISRGVSIYYENYQTTQNELLQTNVRFDLQIRRIFEKSLQAGAIFKFAGIGMFLSSKCNAQLYHNLIGFVMHVT